MPGDRVLPSRIETDDRLTVARGHDGELRAVVAVFRFAAGTANPLMHPGTLFGGAAAPADAAASRWEPITVAGNGLPRVDVPADGPTGRSGVRLRVPRRRAGARVHVGGPPRPHPGHAVEGGLPAPAWSVLLRPPPFWTDRDTERHNRDRAAALLAELHPLAPAGVVQELERSPGTDGPRRGDRAVGRGKRHSIVQQFTGRELRSPCSTSRRIRPEGSGPMLDRTTFVVLWKRQAPAPDRTEEAVAQ